MSHYPIPEVQPRIRRTLVDFMTTAEFEQLKAAPKTVPINPKEQKR